MTKRLIIVLITTSLLYSSVLSFAASKHISTGYTNTFSNLGKAVKKQLNGKSIEFNEAILKIEQKQFNDGLILINRSLVNALETGWINSNLAYRYYEFLDLLKVSETIKNGVDKKLADAFIYSSFTDNADMDGIFSTCFTNTTQSEYSSRLRLLALAGENDPNLTAELNTFLSRYPSKINDGAVNDLKDLIDQKVMVNESKFIIKNIFGKE